MTAPIRPIPSQLPLQQLQQLDTGGVTLDAGVRDGGSSFGDQLKRVLGEVSTAQDTSQDKLQRFLRGEPVELHQVMASAEEAGIAVEMLVELRNKLTDAYRTVINMQS